jgi:hypothetical protein
VTEEDPGEEIAGPSSAGRAATVVSQTYYYVVAAIGLIFLLGGTIAALIALRKWILPVSDAATSFFGPPADTHDAARSFLGALAFAIPGALVFAWHLREARRRERGRWFRAAWGGVLYFHLVALISLLIGLGGVVAMLHAFRDAVVPFCYETRGFDELQAEDPSFQGEVTPIPDIEIPIDSPLVESEECYPSRSEAFRSALDAGIVASVAGGTWAWHLRRGRRLADEAPAG